MLHRVSHGHHAAWLLVFSLTRRIVMPRPPQQLGARPAATRGGQRRSLTKLSAIRITALLSITGPGSLL
jgi:hypothetical protein